MFLATSAKVLTSIISTDPPLASIAALADAETLWAFTVTFLSKVPFPKTLIPSFNSLTNPVSNKSSGVTTAPSSNLFNKSKLIKA